MLGSIQYFLGGLYKFLGRERGAIKRIYGMQILCSFQNCREVCSFKAANFDSICFASQLEVS